MGGVGPDVHQVRDGFAAVSFGLFLKPFSHLEEQHHKDGLRELGLRSGHEADAQRAQRGDAHEEVFAQGFAFDEPFGRFLEGVPAHYQVGDEVQQKVLPGGPVGLFFDDDGHYKQRGGHQNLHAPVLSLLVVVMMFVFMLVMMFVFMLMMVFMMMVLMALTFMLVFMFFFHGCRVLTDAKVAHLPCNPVANLILPVSL